jgi:DNA-directed RNA polymerase specialized sigma24 family protein
MNTPRQHLEELLEDLEFLRVMDLAAQEVMHLWRLSLADARRIVLSAIGEPAALASIYEAWTDARARGTSRGKAKIIIRRRVIDLLRKDTRRAGHTSFEDAADKDAADDDGDELVGEPSAQQLQRSPYTQLKTSQLIHSARDALASFATGGKIQRRQAELVYRRAFQEVSYVQLSRELGCTETALRVRLCKAMRALQRHIRARHPELLELIDVAST